ncbi:hypothetical protein Tco_0052490 [Tanacetum coccineum]
MTNPVLRSAVLTVLVLVTPEPTILLSIPKIPIVTLITTLPPPPPVTNITPVLRVLKGALKQVDHALAILATTRSQVPVAVDKYLGSRLGDALQKKSALFQTMIESKSFNKHPSNIALYHALMESLLSDEEGMDQGVTELLKKKRQHDDQDEDPLAGPNQDQPQDKSEPKTIRAPRNDWFIQPPRAPTSDPELNQGKEVDNGQEQTWFNDMLSTKKVPLTFDELIAASIDFSNFAMNRLKIDKLTKAHLVGLIYELLKGTCQSSIKLEYNIEECYKALHRITRANDHELLELPYIPEDPYFEAALQAPPSPDYVPGPEEPGHAPPSPDYVPGPEHDDDEIVAEDQPYAEDASPIAQSPDYIPESDPEADPEEDGDEDP